MRALALTLAAAAATLGLAAPAAQAGPNHCDQSSVGVLCYDQGRDGTIYQCVVWIYLVQPENNPTCFAIF